MSAGERGEEGQFQNSDMVKLFLQLHESLNNKCSHSHINLIFQVFGGFQTIGSSFE